MTSGEEEEVGGGRGAGAAWKHERGWEGLGEGRRAEKVKAEARGEGR